MKTGPIYLYDNRTQYQEPLAVVYDDAHVEPIIEAFFGLLRPVVLRQHIVVSRTRLHPYDRDRYKNMGSVSTVSKLNA